MTLGISGDIQWRITANASDSDPFLCPIGTGNVHRTEPRFQSDRKGSAARVGVVFPIASILCVLFLYVVPVGFAGNGSPPSADRQPARPSASAVGHAIELSIAYLERSCQPDGQFIYLLDPLTGKQSGTYNVVRHAGAIYSLAFFNRLHPDRNALPAMVRAGNFLRRNYLGNDPSGRMRIVWPAPLGAKPADHASLGATGLGLVALSETERANPNTIPYSDMEGMARFLVFQQKNDGSFFMEYGVTSGPLEGQNKLSNLYFPGEAILGLLSLYEVDHQKQWLVAAGKGLAYLAKSRAGQKAVPPDHWALIATAKFLPHYDQSECPATRGELQHHTIQVVNAFLERLAPGLTADPALDGSVDGQGRTTPTATSLEGLLAALESAPGAEYPAELTGAMRNTVYRGIGFLLRAQIQSGSYAGGMPGRIIGSNARSIPADANAAHIRIDYVQHALCAFLRFEKLFPTERVSTQDRAQSE